MKRPLRSQIVLAVPRYALCLAIVAMTLTASCRKEESAESVSRPLLVAAASDLIPAFEAIGAIFERETGVKVIFSFGSTGTLARQIENGAPVDLFAAADIAFVEQLEQKGLIVSGSKALYARGRITLWTPADSALIIDRLEDLTRPEVKRIAIANPGHAPYGIAAREAMQSAGVYQLIESRLVFGDNVRQAMQYAETGNVDVAITAFSLSVQSSGRWVLIPEQLHRPLDQALAVIANSGNKMEAARFAAFINGEQGRRVMSEFGFVLPKESIKSGE